MISFTPVDFQFYFILRVVFLSTDSVLSVDQEINKSWLGVCCQSNILKNVECEVGMTVSIVDIEMFSVDPDRVLVEGYKMRNKVFVGLVDFSEIDRRTDSW